MKTNAVTEGNQTHESHTHGESQTTTEQKESRYYCDESRHMAELNHPASYILPFVQKLSRRNGYILDASVEGLAEHFQVSQNTIRRGIKALKDAGWLVILKKGLFTSNSYRVLTHRQYTETYPDRCCIKKARQDRQDNPMAIALKTAGANFDYEKIYTIASEARILRLTPEQVREVFVEFAQNSLNDSRTKGYFLDFLEILRISARRLQ